MTNVDGVPWARLHHAYGTAEDVPDLLRTLRSPGADTRQQAHYRLRGNIYHQGTRWEASSHAIGFLVALADDPATPERDLVVRLVRLVALGDVRDEDLPFDADAAFAEAEDATDEDVVRLVDALYDEDKDLDEVPMEIQVAVDARWRRDCYRAAAGHVATYRAWLADGDAEVGAHAAELLAWFPADDYPDALRHWPDVHAAPVGAPTAQGWVDVVWVPLAGASPQAAPASAPAASKPIAKAS